MCAARVERVSVRERVSRQEWQTRVDLAAAYRLVALYGWDDLIFTHHDHEGIALDEGEKPRLAADLGQKRSLILRNHGLLTVGSSAGETFLVMFNLQRACEIQVAARSGGALVEVQRRVLEIVSAQVEAVMQGMGADLVWPALLRKLERIDPSYRQ